MAILATRRRWLVMSFCAASRSPCSRQRLASMYSSCGSSIGKRLISSTQPVRQDYDAKIGKAAVRDIGQALLRLPPVTGGREDNVSGRFRRTETETVAR